MRVTRLELSNLRRFEHAQLAPGPGLNLITGANGAGKTSVLEALHLMAYGRSFRGRVHDGLVRQGASALEVFVEWQAAAGTAMAGRDGVRHRAGLRHSGQAWEGRLDGASVDHLGQLCAALAVVTVEPGSHGLIMGGAENRRRFVDWGLFHVEPDFLPLWRRHARALKQRNALLKRGIRDGQLEAWEQELAASGEPLTRARQRYLEQLQPVLEQVLQALLPAAGASRIVFQPGWRQEELALGDALLLSRDRDLAAGHTTVGPHRADWQLVQAGIPGRNALSRGQAKLTALSALLAQAEHHAALRGDWPVVALDDLASELDRAHQRRVLERVLSSGAQVFVTGTEAPAVLHALHAPRCVFHVEHGQLVAEDPSQAPG
ncbi:DNA replication/repair protein RecF [Cognatiluteimonas telluris]|uniref:DNA replication/repair protein RecF n=1 Tax=Cognatiluteimonas telluris TaxID=1104775 RepID=UPI00140BC519|nr:DNA replication/repair protein RecF [Lysobacter telluris]